MNKALRFLSTLSQRQSIARGTGLMFGGARNLYEVLGYKETLSFDDYWTTYDRDNIAGRIVDAPAKATWRLEPKIVEDVEKPFEDGAQGAAFSTEWAKLNKRLGLMHIFGRADKLAGIGRYSLLLIGTRGTRELSKPISKIKSQEDILYVTPYSENNAKIHKFDTDPNSPRFGRPEVYKIDLMSGDSSTKRGVFSVPTPLRSVNVHHSRVIHIAEGLLEDNVYGEPRLRKVMNLLYDLAKVVGGSAEAFWIIANRGMQMDLDPDTTLNPDDEAALEDEVEDFFNGLRRFIRTQGVTVKSLGSEAPNPAGSFQIVIALISGTTGIPQRILLGSERGQLASEQDRNNWNERILERQLDFGEAIMLRPFVDLLITIGALPPLPDTYGVYWPPLRVLSEKEEAEVAARIGQAVVNISNQKSPVLSPEEFRTRYLKMPPTLVGADISEGNDDTGEPNLDSARIGEQT